MFKSSLLVILSIILIKELVECQTHSQQIVYINNNRNNTWIAGENFQLTFGLDRLARNLKKSTKPDTVPVKSLMIHDDIPESFDARENWPNCADFIGDVYDQGSCGAGWAFGAVSAMSDRICVHSNASQKVRISAEDLNDCCLEAEGCLGNWPDLAWLYWYNHGIVSDDCKAYSIAPCDHYIDGQYEPCAVNQTTPECTQQCDISSDLIYENDKRNGSVYSIMGYQEAMQTEIMTNGPVQVSFEVYEDFLIYKTGVYQHIVGNIVGYHSVKLIGWGLDNDIPYWIAVNSWNSEWGDNGFFKILRGSNECGIELDVIAGIPNL